MASRLELHQELVSFLPKAYYQPPANLKMTYPCIVYSKTGKKSEHGNDSLYLSTQEYQLMVIERDPDSIIADNLERHFSMCSISQYYTIDNLYHTTLTLYY